MDYEIRQIDEDEFPAFMRSDNLSFGEVPSDEDIEAMRTIFEFDRSLAAFEGDRIVGTAGAFAFDLTIPGPATMPVAGVSWVGVIPTHRRRGILTELMRRQLSDVRERGEPGAILLCSESSIYGRFGYGLATTQAQLEIDRPYGSFARQIEAPGRLMLLDGDAAATVVPEVYDRVRCLQPGAVTRKRGFWELHFQDPERWRRGMSGRMIVVYEAPDGQAEGYVTYRIKQNWSEGLPGNTLWIEELMAETLEARAALWKYCLNVDLVAKVQAPNRPIDDPLRWMLMEPRRLRFTGYGDFLWLRLLDVPAALSARGYLGSGHLVFEVEDMFCPENSGCYELIAGQDGAQCRRTSAEPDVSLDVADLGAAYLGGVGFGTLARAGRVREMTAGAVERADALFASAQAPWCAVEF